MISRPPNEALSPSKPRSPPRRFPTARLIMMVIASNHLAATSFTSAPYLTATKPPPVRTLPNEPAFRFVPLRPATGRIDDIVNHQPTAEHQPAATVSSSENPAEYFSEQSVPPAFAPEDTTSSRPDTLDPVAPIELTTLPSGSASAAAASPESRPRPGSDGVSLEDFLSFFPEPRPTASRATYQKK
jgi:hypothetical protein